MYLVVQILSSNGIFHDFFCLFKRGVYYEMDNFLYALKTQSVLSACALLGFLIFWLPCCLENHTESEVMICFYKNTHNSKNHFSNPLQRACCGIQKARPVTL
jgi:hypothetical protein